MCAVAGEFVTAELALALARVATARLPSERPQVLVIIRDTRESGEMLEAAMAAGVAAAGGDALLGGILPTPAAPLLIARYGLDRLVSCCRPRTTPIDNGIKFFSAPMGQAPDRQSAIEARLSTRRRRRPADLGRVRTLHGTTEDYLRELQERFGGLDLAGLRVALDCAHGAAHRVAPEIFRRLGADVTAIATEPDGRNINDGCGSTHVAELAAAVRAGVGHDVGFAFDGDGDRVLAVDRAGARSSTATS